jgi:hypothetical protein
LFQQSQLKVQKSLVLLTQNPRSLVITLHKAPEPSLATIPLHKLPNHRHLHKPTAKEKLKKSISGIQRTAMKENFIISLEVSPQLLPFSFNKACDRATPEPKTGFSSTFSKTFLYFLSRERALGREKRQQNEKKANQENEWK